MPVRDYSRRKNISQYLLANLVPIAVLDGLTDCFRSHGLSWNADSMRIFRHVDIMPLPSKHVRQINAVTAVRMAVAKHFGQDQPMRCSGSP